MTSSASSVPSLLSVVVSVLIVCCLFFFIIVVAVVVAVVAVARSTAARICGMRCPRRSPASTDRALHGLQVEEGTLRPVRR